MTYIIKVFICLATLIYALNTIISIIVNSRHKQTMLMHGKKPLMISYLMTGVNFLMFCLCFIITYYDFTGKNSANIFTAIFILVAAIDSLIYLRFRKSLSASLRMTVERGEELKNTRNMIMSNASHEIRTPMNTILGMTEIMKKEERMPESCKENLDKISAAGGQLIGVVNNLIDFAKIESDHLDIIECDYNTKDLISEIMTKATFMLGEKSVELLIDVDPNMPAILHGDDIRIIQALSNVISNACKYTYVGIITIRFGFSTLGTGRINMHVDIEDTGTGIRDEDKPFVFVPNINEGTNRDRSNKGAGLSLMITRSIIEKMGGAISFSSEEGVGTNFNIVIPQNIISSEAMGDIQSELAHPNVERYQFTTPMAKVLVVDDNIVNLFVAKEIMTNYDMEIQTVQSGQECIDAVKENYFDLIFMDYVMPGMDGHETLLKLRQFDNEYFKKIPIIALTAQSAAGGDKIYLEEGFQGFLSKPIDVHELEKLLLKFIPEEYICYKEGASVQNAQKAMDDRNWYKRLCSVLEGFDVKKGLENCNNDYTSYLNLLKIIYNDSFGQTQKLIGFVNDGDVEGFRIAVHAMKSVTASAGDMKLSFICQENENAAKGEDLAYIKNHINTLVSEYEAFIGKIDLILQRESEMMSKGMVAHKENRSESNIKELTEKLLESLDEYNLDESEQILDELEHTNLPFDKSKAISDIRDLLELFKYEDAADAVRKAFGD